MTGSVEWISESVRYAEYMRRYAGEMRKKYVIESFTGEGLDNDLRFGGQSELR